ncbi:MAG: hypothetical protein HYV08_16875 [Deltaproteobacteria bacterium]|nr:hypothetical protein [Deltaproteobacteria bacterium]MBI3077451.1 hypothetical protein [Deltaproteobacteria bacterium]
MERIFWIDCPGCGKSFYADWPLRQGKYKLHCPFCGHRFLPQESPRIFE